MYLASEVLPPAGTHPSSVVEAALAEMDGVYGFVYARVGNRADAEDLTQEIALKALPRLREGAPAPAVRAYVYASARSVLADFWSRQLRMPQSELREDLHLDREEHEVWGSPQTVETVAGILDGLAPHYRQVLELRFLRGYSVREVAREMGKTVENVKVMQLRALRKAASSGSPSRSTAAAAGAGTSRARSAAEGPAGRRPEEVPSTVA